MASARLVTLLWEDALQPGELPRRAAEPAKHFGPGNLLAACVADHRGEPGPWSIRRLLHHEPKKGNGNVLLACREYDGSDGPVIAVLDEDRVRDLLGLAGSACIREIRAEFDARCPHVELCLLRENIESLVSAARGEEPPLLRKPAPDERDRVLNGVAFAAVPETRSRLIAAVPSFGRLVGRVVRLLSG